MFNGKSMMRLCIIRHGNTFESNEIPRRVDSKTNIPLVESEKMIVRIDKVR